MENSVQIQFLQMIIIVDLLETKTRLNANIESNCCRVWNELFQNILGNTLPRQEAANGKCPLAARHYSLLADLFKSVQSNLEEKLPKKKL